MVDTGNIKNMAKKQTTLTAYKYNEGCQECWMVSFYKKFIFIPNHVFCSKKGISGIFFWFLESIVPYFDDMECILRK